jgi:DNA invertase Pin-like site-specific DNA recombinase
MGRTPRTTAKQNEQMVEMYKQGKSWNDIAECFGVNRMTVYRRIKHLIDEEKLAP